MRISDWSSDVCSSDLAPAAGTESAITIEENLPTAAGKLNPDYTFINFIEGKSNSHARAAAEHVVETPGGTYNPLLIYGSSGLGKTHLMHAVGNALLDRKSTRLNSSHYCAARMPSSA